MSSRPLASSGHVGLAGVIGYANLKFRAAPMASDDSSSVTLAASAFAAACARSLQRAAFCSP